MREAGGTGEPSGAGGIREPSGAGGTGQPSGAGQPTSAGSTRAKRAGLAALVAIVLLAMAAAIALAEVDHLGGKLMGGREVVVAQGETLDHDLYAAGGTVSVNGTVNGDVIATAGQVTINGTVNGDVMVAGGQVAINGTVNGDVRAAGGSVAVDGSIKEDLFVAGGLTTIAKGATVGGDVIVWAGRLTVDGAIAGNITGATSQYTKTGTVGGNDTITITQAQRPVAEPTPTDRVFDAIRHYLAVLLVGVLAIWLTPRLLMASESTIRRDPIRAVFWGFGGIVSFVLLAIVIPLIAVIVGLIFAGLGFGDLAGYIIAAGVLFLIGLIVVCAFIAAYVADVIVGLALARAVMRESPVSTAPTTAPVVARPDPARTLLLLAVGAAVVVILCSIPVIGGLFKFIVIVVGVGGLLGALSDLRRPRAVPVSSVVAPPPEAAPPA
ncbi:MAG: hypothetical protein ACJ761_04700 [Chloroflexota bacterium]